MSKNSFGIDESIKLTGKFNKREDIVTLPRRVVVEIDYYDINVKARVIKTETMFVDTLIGALGGAIRNAANAIPYIPLDFQSKPLQHIDAYAKAIMNLAEEEIQPFEVAFHYKDGFEKNYRIISEMK